MNPSRRRFLHVSTAAVSALSLGPQNIFAQQESSTPPNIIWLIADDVGGKDLGCYGHPTLRTPNIDSIAAEGMRFTNAFVTTSSCSPSRASMFTGKYPHSTGAENLHDPIPPGQNVLPTLLRPKGYYSGSVGKFHMGPNAEKQFDAVWDDLADWKKFLEERPKERPFFLSVGFHDAHRPFDRGCVEPKYEHDEIVVPPYLPDIPEAREELAGYYDEITRMDSVIGDMLAYLDRNNLSEKTVVLFVSDNGMPFPRAKTTLYDSGIKTPMIVRWKGHIDAGQEYSGLVSTVDMAPAMLDAAQIEIPEDIEGISIARQVLNPNEYARDQIVAEKNWHDLDDHARAVRTQRYKYIRNSFPERPLENSADSTVAPLFQKMRQMRDAGTLTLEQMLLFRSRRAVDELYDIELDPYEFHNLAYEPAYRRVLQSMQRRLDRWIEETNDISPSKSYPDEFHPETGERIRPAHQNK